MKRFHTDVEKNVIDSSWAKTELEKELYKKIVLRRQREMANRTCLCGYFYKLKGLNLKERLNPSTNN